MPLLYYIIGVSRHQERFNRKVDITMQTLSNITKNGGQLKSKRQIRTPHIILPLLN